MRTLELGIRAEFPDENIKESTKETLWCLEKKIRA